MSDANTPLNKPLDKKGCAKGCGSLIMLVIIFMISGKVIDGVGNLLSGSSEKGVLSTTAETRDGTYTYSDYFMEVTMRVSGSRWSATIRYKSGNDAEYESGSVSGNDLYDSSGLFKIGHISGNSIQTTFGEKRITLHR
jgi:hypothetical protein